MAEVYELTSSGRLRRCGRLSMYVYNVFTYMTYTSPCERIRSLSPQRSPPRTRARHMSLSLNKHLEIFTANTGGD